MKKHTSLIREEWKVTYRIMRSIASHCKWHDLWAGKNPQLAKWYAVEIGILIRSMDNIPHVYPHSRIAGYEVLFRDRRFTVDYTYPLNINVNGAANNRAEWQSFAKMLEARIEADRKRQALYQIIATASDEAVSRIYNSAVVWAAWDKVGR